MYKTRHLYQYNVRWLNEQRLSENTALRDVEPATEQYLNEYKAFKINGQTQMQRKNELTKQNTESQGSKEITVEEEKFDVMVYNKQH